MGKSTNNWSTHWPNLTWAVRTVEGLHIADCFIWPSALDVLSVIVYLRGNSISPPSSPESQYVVVTGRQYDIWTLRRRLWDKYHCSVLQQEDNSSDFWPGSEVCTDLRPETWDLNGGECLCFVEATGWSWCLLWWRNCEDCNCGELTGLMTERAGQWQWSSHW